MIAAPARVGKWLDTDVPCSPEVLRAAKAQGYQGILRYGPLPNNPATFDLSAGELERILAADLQCGMVQHVRAGSWDPSHHSGKEDAQCIADFAKAIGYPAGCHVWQDLESIGGSGINTTVFALDWQRAMLSALYRAGLYHGFAVPLSPQDLYDLPGFDSYWSDMARRPIATRGNAIVQGGTVRIAGTEFDEDIVAPDALACLPFVATPDPGAGPEAA